MPPATRPAVFLDLNGTLVMPIKVNHPAEYATIPGTVDALQLLKQAGYCCPIITVQSRIDKGIYTMADFATWFGGWQADLAREGASVVGPYVCPHRWRDPCACKKPQPTLYLHAAEELGIDLARSWVVGDSIGDVQAGHALGCQTILLRTGNGLDDLAEAAPFASHVADDILAAAMYLTRQ